MIRVIKGIYGKYSDGMVTPMTEKDGPFSLPDTEEERLVKLGIAEYCDGAENKGEKNQKGRKNGKRPSIEMTEDSEGLEELPKVEPAQPETRHGV